MVAETVEQQAVELTPGQRLKAAREARDIERADIARWLKLDEKLINAIEDGDEEYLPEPVFIVGYIRSYAKLVELSPDQLVKEFMESHKLPEPDLPKQDEPVPGRMSKVAVSLPKRFSVAANSPSTNVRRFVLISVAIVLAGVVSWISVFVGEPDNEQLAGEEFQDLNVTTTVATVDTRPEGNAVTSGSVNESVESAPPAAESKQAKPKQITIPLPLTKKERSDPGVIATLDAEGLAVSELPLENIAVRFMADSWVDIRDATGRRLIRSLGVAGATKEVEGVAPFQVLIGYGPGVELTYNGELFDFSKYQGKQEVARFTLKSTENLNNNNEQN